MLDLQHGISDAEIARAHQGYLRSPPKIRGNPSHFAKCLRSTGLTSRKLILAIFDNRVSWSAIVHWRAGDRGAPPWAYEKLIGYLNRIVYLMDTAPVQEARGVAQRRAINARRANLIREFDRQKEKAGL